jgi:hypothetical protein
MTLLILYIWRLRLSSLTKAVPIIPTVHHTLPVSRSGGANTLVVCCVSILQLEQLLLSSTEPFHQLGRMVLQIFDYLILLKYDIFQRVYSTFLFGCFSSNYFHLLLCHL